MDTNKKNFGNLLVEAGFISEEQLTKALQIQEETGEKIGEVLISQGIISQDDVIQVLEFQLGVPHVNLDKVTINQDIIDKIPEKIAKRHYLMPISIENNKIIVAMSYPFNLYAIDDVRFATNLEVFPKIASISDIKNAITKYYSPFLEEKVEEKVEEAKSSKNEIENLKEENSKEKQTNQDNDNNDDKNIVVDEKIVKLLDEIFKEALKNEASDIYIEPQEDSVRVRFCYDGELKESQRVERKNIDKISLRVKTLCNMDINQNTIVQNGIGIYATNSKETTIKVFVLPTIYGEKIRIQLVSDNFNAIDFSELGFCSEDLEKINSLLSKKTGLILVSGPLQCGKTTTFYSMLKKLRNPSKNIISIENLCEIKIDDITQIDLKESNNDDFESFFKAVLKQNPDVIAISEIDDIKTAEMAINTANMGHLVIGMINSKDSISAINRLLELGISPYSITNALLGVTSQKLIRTLCMKCMKRFNPNSDEIKILQNDFYLLETENVKLSKSVGCRKCRNIGFKGKIGVFEILVLTQKIKEDIVNKAAPEIIKRTATIDGTKTIKDNAFDLALKGETTIDEVKKIID